MANIRDVARHAEVSISSVSNVLNGRTDQMRPETLQRIEQAVFELNYHPNRVAQQLKTGQSKMIGLLVPSIVNPSFAALAREVDLGAKKHRYRVLLGNTYRQEDEEQAFLEDMFSHGVRGIIVAASDMKKKHFSFAAERGMVMVNYDSRILDNSAPDARLFDSVSMDNVEAGRLAAQHLIDRGCRNIVFVTEASQTMSRGHKVKGFFTALEANGMSCEMREVIEGKALSAYGDTEMSELGYSLAAKVLKHSPRPDGVVAINDALAIGLIAGLRDAGAGVPQDISVVGIDNIPLSGLINPGLTSVMPPLAEMAQVMVEHLLNRINNPELALEEFVFTPTLVCRQSVRAGSS